jgi:hypothetical protein
MNSRRLNAVVAVAIALGVLGRADAQDEASQEPAAICGNPQCPGIVGAWQQDLTACAAKTARVRELEDVIGTLQGKVALCSTSAEQLAKAVATANAWKEQAERLEAEKEELRQRADSDVAALRKEVERLKTENDKQRPQTEGKTQQIASEGKESQRPAVEKKQPEASGQAQREEGECVALTAAINGVCFVKTRTPGWLMARSARSGDEADQGSTLFLRAFIDARIIPRLPQVRGSRECGLLRDVLKSQQPLDPRPSVDAVFVRSGEVVGQCYDSGEGDWKLRPVPKGDRKHQAWILVPETKPAGGVRP